MFELVKRWIEAVEAEREAREALELRAGMTAEEFVEGMRKLVATKEAA
jgi:hypothetical protein